MTSGRTWRRSQLRARTALLLAPLVMLASSSLGVAVAAPAQAQVVSSSPAPPAVTAPQSPAGLDTPSWDYVLPSDPEPVVTTSDSSTVTTRVTHSAACALDRDGTTALAEGSCGVVSGAGFRYTAAPLGVDGTHVLSLQTVRRTTATTVTQGEDGTSTTTTGEPLVERSSTERSPYVLDTTDPVVGLARGPAGDGTVRWDLSVQDVTATTASCAASGGSVVTCGPAVVEVRPTSATSDVALTVTVTDAVGRSGTASATHDQLSASVSGPTGPSSDDQPVWTLTGDPLTGVSCVLTASDGSAVPPGECSAAGYRSAPLGRTTGTTYVLEVTGTDAAGTTGTLVAAPYVLDSAPDLRVTGRPAAYDRDRQPRWTFTAGEAVTVRCTLTTGQTAVDGGTCDATGYRAPLLPTTPGTTYALSVQVTDGLSNSATIDAGQYVLDTDVVAALAPPTSPGTVVRPGWTLTGEELTGVVCTFTDASGTPLPGTCATTGFLADPLPGDGTYDLTVAVTDRAGNSTVLDGGQYVLDSAVDLTVTPQAPVVRTRTPTWAFSGERLAEVRCALTGPDGTLLSGGTCLPSGFTASTLTVDGPYTLVVRAVDLAGNVLLTPGSTLVLDTQVDVTVTAPPSPGRDPQPRWELSGEPRTVTCELRTGGVLVPGGSCGPTGYTAPLLPGTPGTDYVLLLTVTDAVGNVRALDPLTHRLDTELVATVVAPPSPSSARTPTWSVDGEPVALTCVLTDASGTELTGGTCGPTGYTAPSLTPTTGADLLLELTLTDAAGNTRTDRLTHRVDTVLELVLGEPGSPGNDLTPSWTFSGEGYASAECTLTGPAGVVPDGECSTAGYTAPTLEPSTGAEHVLTVTLTDPAGNRRTVSSTPYVLDTAVQLVVAGPTGPSADREPRWSFEGETYLAASCVLRSTTGALADLASCSPTGAVAAPLPTTPGTSWVLTVTADDQAGNRTTASSAAYLLDTDAQLTVTPPAGPDDVTTPRWAIATEADARVTCTLTGPAGVVDGGQCSTTAYQAPVLPGAPGARYVLVVDVVDRAGNPASSTTSYLLDTVLQLSVVGPTGTGRDPRPRWSFVGETYATTSCTLTADGRTVPGGDCRLDGYTAPLLAPTTGTDHVLTVRATDPAGNALTVGSLVYRLDTLVELVVDGPTGPSPDRTPSFAFTGEPLATVACTLTGPDGLVVPGGACSAAGYQAPELRADGDHVLTVAVTDGPGNERTVTRTYDLDTLALTVLGPTGPSPDRRPSWTFTDEPYTAATCELTGPAGVVTRGPCTTTSGFTAPLLPETPGADYVLTVTATDSIGTTGTVSASPYRLDTQRPTATITGPTGAGRTSAVTWSVSVDEALAMASCVLRRDGAAVLALACQGSTPVELTTTGRYDVVVAVTDLAGNSSTTTSAGYVFDALAPAAPAVSPLRTVTSSPAAAWQVTGEAGTDVTCRLLQDGTLVQDWTACAGGYSRELGTDGTWTLEARATDSVGSGPTTTATWVLDRVLPAPPSIAGPTGPSQDRAPVWTFTAEPGTTTCRVLSGDLVVQDTAACSGSGVTGPLALVPDGPYALEVVVTDAAGNRTAATSAPYVLDTTAPLAPVVSGPTGPSSQRTPSWSWTGEAGAAATCRLSSDRAAGLTTACTSPYAPVLPSDGTWTLAVDLTDAAGNRGPAASSPPYLLDTTAPAAPTVTPPAATGRDLVPAWAVVAEPGTALQCRLTAGGSTGEFAACAVPVTTDLTGRGDGPAVLEVRAVDRAGNVGPAGSGSYLLDTVAPSATTVTGPASPGRTRAPSFTFAVPAGTTATCRVSSGTTVLQPSAPCTSPAPLDLGTAKDGPYVLSVRLVDAAGNTGPASAATYVLDTTGPLPPQLITTPTTPSSARRPVLSFLAETGATTVCRVTSAAGTVREAAPCTSPFTVEVPDVEGSYAVAVWGVDALGNVGDPTSFTYVYSRLAPAGPVVVAPRSPDDDRGPVWTITGTGPFECQLTRGTTVLRPFAACKDSFRADLFGQVDGTYVLAVRVPAPVGEYGSALSRYVLRANGPAAPVVVAQSSPSTNPVATWTVSSPEPGVVAECQLLVQGSLRRDWTPCAVSAAGSAVTEDLSVYGDGLFTLVVRLTDPQGNTGASTRSDYVVDTSAPAAVGIVAPASPGFSREPVWLLSAPGSVVECRLTTPQGTLLGGRDWAPCTSPVRPLLDQGEGVYSLGVRALSAAGTPGPEVVSQYRLLAPLGVLAFVEQPVSGATRQPRWTFVLPDGTTGRCTLTEPSGVRLVRACESPFVPDLQGADGTYLLELVAVDAAGATGSPVGSTYVLRTQAPPPPVLTLVPGSPSSAVLVEWRFAVVPGAGAQCRVVRPDGATAAFAPCTTATAYRLDLFAEPEGAYELQVRSVADDLSSPFTASTYVFDRSAPGLPEITRTPASPGRTTTPTWEFTGPAGSSFECRAAGSPTWLRCTSPTPVGQAPGGTFRLQLSAEGEHAVEVRLVDATGRTGPATRGSYVLDLTAPRPPVLVTEPGTDGYGTLRTPTWTTSPAAVGETTLCQLTGGSLRTAPAPCPDSFTAPELRQDGTYALVVQRRDAAGNLSTQVVGRYVLDTRAPAVVRWLERPAPSGTSRTTTWRFSLQQPDLATCVVQLGIETVGEGSQDCSTGAFTMRLPARPGTYQVTVMVVDRAGNEAASALTGSYALLGGDSGAVRVGEPVVLLGPPTRPVAPTADTPERTPVTPVGLAAPALRVPGQAAPRLDPEPVPVPDGEATTGQDRPKQNDSGSALPKLLRDADDVPGAIRSTLTTTLRQPTLPLALLAIVLLFLLAQNSIDRRDPKLASAPVEADPDLDFSPFVRRPGGAT